MRITKYDTELQDDKLNNPEMISHMMCATATRFGRVASPRLV